MKYFIVTSGLRGCYMPNSINVFAFDTRRALKSYLTDEANVREGCVGLTKANLAWAAAHAWKGKGQGTIIPFGYKPKVKQFCIELTPIDRREYLKRLAEEGE
jgi:hypothetical protein